MVAADAHRTADDPEGRPSRFFFGWRVVAGVFVMLAVASGLVFYNLTVYLRALTVEQGFSVGAVSGATALCFLVSGMAGIPVASLIARHDARLSIAGGAVVAGLALGLLGRVHSLWQLYPIYALLGLGFAGASLVPGMTLVTRWFTRRRAVAVSVASTGLSVGGIVITPLSAGLIQRHGLAAVSPWLGLAFVAGVVPITLLLVRPSPEALGLRPDGDPEPAGVPTGAVGVPFRAARTSRFFLAVTAGYVLVMLAQVGGLAHHFNLVSERVDQGLAARAVSILAASSVVGRLSGGWLVTRLSIRSFTATLMVAQGVALSSLAFGTEPAALVLSSVAFGLTVGNLLMLHPLLLVEAFGTPDYGRIYSLSQFVMTIGVAVGPALVGALHDLAGGYTEGFLAAAAASMTGSVLLLAGGSVERARAVR